MFVFLQSSLAQIADRNRRVLGQLAPIGNAIGVRRSRLELLPTETAIGEVVFSFPPTLSPIFYSCLLARTFVPFAFSTFFFLLSLLFMSVWL